MRQKAY